MRSPKGFNMPVRQPAEIATGETGGISAPTCSTTLKGLNNKHAAFVTKFAPETRKLSGSGLQIFHQKLSVWGVVMPRVATRGYSVNGRTDIARLRILTLSGSAHRTASPAGSVCAYSSPDSVGG